MRMKPLLAVFFLSILCLTLAADRIIIKTGFLTGNDYTNFSETEKRAYCSGFVNGLVMAPTFGAPKEKTAWIEEYSVGMTDQQVAAILTKFLNDNPGKWQRPMSILSFEAMKTAYDKEHPSTGDK
jgi:fructose-specific phosphotransferase system IIC component